MNESALLAILPLIVLGVASAVLMLAVAFGARLIVVAVLTVVSLVAAVGAVAVVPLAQERQATALLLMDGYALFYVVVLLLASLAVVVLSYAYLANRPGDHGAYFILVVLSALGSAALAASTHFASFFLSLEVLSVSLYALIAYRYQHDFAIEAGMKYLILAGASSAFLLFGMALSYAEVGSMVLSDTVRGLATGDLGGLTIFGLAMMTVGVGFKLAVVPFHLWTPDVYEGAPAPVTALVASVSKGAVFALLLRYLGPAGLQGQQSLFLAFALIALASMFAGNVLALLQTNVKRLLAYSSISHLGYLLVAFVASGELGAVAATFYIVAYIVTTLGAFGVVTVLSDAERDADAMADYRGLFWRRPWLAMVFTMTLLSLAGMPLTAGFVGKFFVASAGIGMATGGVIGTTLWVLVMSLVLTSAIGLFYYLRLVALMYARPTEETPALAPPARAPAAWLMLGVLVALLVMLGLYPGPLLDSIAAAMASLL